MLRNYLIALGSLTVLPAPLDEPPTPAELARARWWYPAVGLLLGAVLAALTWLAAVLGAPLVGAFLVVLAWVAVTGALHLHGVGDLADGILHPGSAEDRLRDMKDPHRGTFGLAAVVLVLLGKFAAVAELIVRMPEVAPALVLGAAILGRSLVLVLAAGTRDPRPEGAGKQVVEATTWLDARLALIGTAILIALLTSSTASPLLFLAIWGLVAGTVFGLRWLCVQRLGGVTGDCLGAGIEIAELLFLVLTALLASAS